MPDSTPSTEPERLLDAAESLFAGGKLDQARGKLVELLERDDASPAVRTVALGDLAVIAATTGDLDYAVACAGEALELEADYVPALEVLAHCARERGRSVLIVVDYFHPSVGGTEVLAENAGVALQALGWKVEVAARALPDRVDRSHRGMPIHEISSDPLSELTQLVAGGGYDSILVFSDPLAWPVPAVLSLPSPRPRIVAVPCINAEGYARFEAHPDLRERYRLLASSADVLVYSSLSGYDARLCEELGLDGIYVPNAVNEAEPGGEFREACGIDSDAPLLLAVGNQYPEKNHAGLLEALRGSDGDWRLAIVGRPSPDHPAVAHEVARLAALDPRVTIVPGAAAEAVAAGMAGASLLLLPSLAEATPLVLLEAMRARLPWIATPTCGSAHDHAGGLIVSLDRFGHAIGYLLEHDDEAARLGSAGRAHFETSYRWDVVGARYSSLLGGPGESGDITPPRAAVKATGAVRAAFHDATGASARSEPPRREAA